jgi:phospholipid/cholesterol/gamma-HCH transport system substrate-binding protein
VNFTITKEVKIGLIVITAIFLLIYGLNFLKGQNMFTGRTRYFVLYDNVGGLTESNPVYYKGFVIGKVRKITFANDNSNRLVVDFAIAEPNFNIPKNSIASIFSDGLLGTKAIELRFGNSTDLAQSGDTLLPDLQPSLTEEVTKQVLPVKDKAERLLMTIDSLMVSLNHIFTEGTNGNLRSSIENIDEITRDMKGLVKEQRVKLNKISGYVENITKSLNDNNQKLSQIIANINQITDSVAKSNLTSTINNANIAMKQTSEVMEKINKGEGSIGMLVNNDSLYKNLEAASRDLDKLFEDIRLHPKRYVHFSVFGKKDKSEKKKSKK